MEKAIIKFDDIEIQKQKFHQHKGPISIKNVDIDKIAVSDKVPFGKKKDLNILLVTKMLQKLNLHVFFSQKWLHIEKILMKLNMYPFLIKDNELLEEYNENWKSVSNAIKKDFHSNPVYIKKYLRTKIKSYKGKINPNFDNNKIPKEIFQYICLSVILLDSIFKTDKNYYPQVFLEECKYFIKEKRIHNYITDDVEISDSDKENSDEKTLEKLPANKNSDEEHSGEEILMKRILVKKSPMKNKNFFLHIQISSKATCL